MPGWHTPAAFDQHRPPRQQDVDACVHCGFCLPTCPTYVLWGQEMDSPRGRIVLMAEGLEEGSGLTPDMATHFDRCLGCMACVTACPSGVRYDRLIEATRPQVERNLPRASRERAIRRSLLSLITHPGLLRASLPLVAAWRTLGLHTITRRTNLRSRFPRLAAMEAMAPPRPARPSFRSLPRFTPARGDRRATVALLQGCAQRVFFADVNADTVRVLSAEGFDVIVPTGPRCCGALALHTGYEAEAISLARRAIRDLERADMVVTNAAGCGSAMKGYGELLSDDPAWRDRARAFAGKVRDVCELLAEVEPRAPRRPVELTVAYHDPCHLAHAQGIREQPRTLLRSIPGLTLVEPDEWEICCGSAGLYNVLQPEAGAELGRRKVRNLLTTGAQVIAAGNPGCALQIAALLEEAGRPLPVHHPVELVARSVLPQVPSRP